MLYYMCNPRLGMYSGGARLQNLGGGAFEGLHILGGKIEFQEISPTPVVKIFDSLGFFPGYTQTKIFPEHFQFFLDLSKLYRTY